MKRTFFLIAALLLLLLLTQSASAGSSPDYRIDWSNALTGSGGSASSPAYQVNITVGQTVDHASTSPLYRVKMGFWSGFEGVSLFLPIIKKGP